MHAINMHEYVCGNKLKTVSINKLEITSIWTDENIILIVINTTVCVPDLGLCRCYMHSIAK